MPARNRAKLIWLAYASELHEVLESVFVGPARCLAGDIGNYSAAAATSANVCNSAAVSNRDVVETGATSFAVEQNYDVSRLLSVCKT
jgi:hypothetical protein